MPSSRQFPCIIGSISLLLAAASLQAQVEIAGSSTNYQDIQSAVNDAVDGDTILIQSGVYYEHDVLVDRKLTITARSHSGGQTPVTIDADYQGRHFRITDDVELVGIRLRHGLALGSDINAGGGGGAILHDAGLLSVTDCVFLSNETDGTGGAIMSSSLDDLTVRTSVFRNNAAYWGPHVYAGVFGNNDSTPGKLCTIEDCEFYGAESTFPGAIGERSGAITAWQCSLHMSDVIIDGGEKTTGIIAYGSGQGLSFTATVINTVVRNMSNGGPSGAHFRRPSPVILENVDFQDNQCGGSFTPHYNSTLLVNMVDSFEYRGGELSGNTSDGSPLAPGVDGAPICIADTDGNSVLTDLDIHDNVFAGSGGVMVGSAGALVGDTVTLERCNIYNNLLRESIDPDHPAHGGAIARRTNTSPTIRLVDTVICGNSEPQINASLIELDMIELVDTMVMADCAPLYDGGDFPDPNPVPNADGTRTWYVGNNTQFPVIQIVLDVCQPGDEVVVMGGEYVESLRMDTPDVLLRPSTTPGGSDADAGFQRIVFWNPTEGFGIDTGHAIRIGPGASGAVIGRPAEFTQIANGDMVPTLLPFGGGVAEPEFVADAVYVPFCNIAYTDVGSMTRCQRGLSGYTGDDLCTEFWSRTINNYALRTENSTATVSHCAVKSQNGFGGGALVTGETDATAFIECRITDTYSGGTTEDGYPVRAVAIYDGSPTFSGCSVSRNQAGPGGVIHQSGGAAAWIGCLIGGRGYDDMNNAPASEGIYVMQDGAHPRFFNSTFRCNLSRFGTIYLDSTENRDDEYVLVSDTQFLENSTVSTQYGAVAWCVDETPGRSPLIVFDRCQWTNLENDSGTQSGITWWEHDVHSNYFPTYRILRDLSGQMIRRDTSVAGVAAGDAPGSVSVAGDLNGDGMVDGQDLAILLAAWGR